MATYTEDGPTAKSVRGSLRSHIAGWDGERARLVPRSYELDYPKIDEERYIDALMILARAIDELREQTGITEKERLSILAEEGYKRG